MLNLVWMDKPQKAWAQWVVSNQHYLKTPVDSRCSVEGYQIEIGAKTKDNIFGLFIFGRPEATKCYPWYGSVEDVATGRSEVTRWQVINLARVWFSTQVQPGGKLYRSELLPGFIDRKGGFKSMLASTAINQAADSIGFDYLMARPPCFLDEPYEIKWLLSYCDTRVHKGTIYKAAGFELFRTNQDGIQTWRKPLRPLTEEEHQQICWKSLHDDRARRYRSERLALGNQLSFQL